MKNGLEVKITIDAVIGITFLGALAGVLLGLVMASAAQETDLAKIKQKEKKE